MTKLEDNHLREIKIIITCTTWCMSAINNQRITDYTPEMWTRKR